jgi:hypothetical protein
MPATPSLDESSRYFSTSYVFHNPRFDDFSACFYRLPVIYRINMLKSLPVYPLIGNALVVDHLVGSMLIK